MVEPFGVIPAGLRVVPAPNPSPMTLDGTRTYLVGRIRPVVVDPGPDLRVHREALLRALGGAPPVAILLTHAHADHAAGAPALAQATGAPVWLAAGALEPALPVEAVDRWIGPDDQWETDAGVLRPVLTPGHTPEHMAFAWSQGALPQPAGIFVGDLLMGHGDTTLVAPPEGDLGLYLASLQRVAELNATALFPTHGPPITDPEGTIRRFLRHREERLEQVRDAMAAGLPANPALLVQAIYGSELNPALRGAAEGSVAAMLCFLGRQPGPGRQTLP